MINGDINEFIDKLWSGEEHHSTLVKDYLLLISRIIDITIEEWR